MIRKFASERAESSSELPNRDTSARLLKFPTPQRKMHAEISNVRWFPNTNEVSQIFVDPETRICRIESRWRLTGKNATPVLTHWRQTRDCKGHRGWITLVNRK